MKKIIFLSIASLILCSVVNGETSQAREPASYPVKAGKESALTPDNSADPYDSSGYAFGSWNGWRQRLFDQGIEFGLIYKGEIERNFSGGKTVKTSYLENLDLRLNLDAEKLWGLKGTSFFIYALGNKGGESGNAPSVNVGDSQGTSNLETKVDDFRIYELWVQQQFADNKASVLFGLHDLNSEFYVTDSSSQFFNASFGIGREISQTGVNGPSIFPYASLALRLRAEPTDTTYLQTGLFEAAAGDLEHPKGTYLNSNADQGHLMIAEAGVQSGTPLRPTKLAIGGWGYNRTFDHLAETFTDANGNSVAAPSTSHGYYFLADHAVTNSVSVFLRAGKASTTTNLYSYGVSGGFVFKSLFESGHNDKLGIAFTTVGPGAQYKQMQSQSGVELNSSEMVYEINYRYELRPGVIIQPAFQHIQNPGLSKDLKNSEYGALRIELNL